MAGARAASPLKLMYSRSMGKAATTEVVRGERGMWRAAEAMKCRVGPGWMRLKEAVSLMEEEEEEAG